MTTEYDDKGKYFTDVVTKMAVPATIQTATHLLRGKIHVRTDQRFKDELDLDEHFLAITDVSILGADGQIVFQAPFLAIQRAQIVWVMPEENRQEGSY